MKSVIVKSALIAFLAALAASAAQMLVVGEANPAISGGVAGAVAVSVMLSTKRSRASDQEE